MTEETKLSVGVRYILDRLKEPSTWAGIAVFIGSFGLDQETIDRLVSNGPAIAVGVAAVIAVFAPSTSRKAKLLAEEAKKKAESAESTAHEVKAETDQIKRIIS